MCFHEDILVCCLTGLPCIGKDRCADYLSKESGNEKLKQGYKFSIKAKTFVKTNLREESKHGSHEVRRR